MVVLPWSRGSNSQNDRICFKSTTAPFTHTDEVVDKMTALAILFVLARSGRS